MKLINVFSKFESLTKPGLIETIIVINRIAFGILLFCLLLVLSKLL